MGNEGEKEGKKGENKSVILNESGGFGGRENGRKREKVEGREKREEERRTRKGIWRVKVREGGWEEKWGDLE